MLECRAVRGSRMMAMSQDDRRMRCGMRHTAMRRGRSRNVSNSGISTHGCDDAMRKWLIELEELQEERPDSVAFDTQRLDGRDSGRGRDWDGYSILRNCLFITAENETALKA